MLNQWCQSHKECVTETFRDSISTEIMNVDCINGMFLMKLHKKEIRMRIFFLGICVCAKDYIMTEELHDCIRYSDNGNPFSLYPFVFIGP